MKREACVTTSQRDLCSPGEEEKKKERRERRRSWEDAPMVQARAASTGVVFSSMSLPYKHKPASSRKLSLAPRPASLCSNVVAVALLQWFCCNGGVAVGVSPDGFVVCFEQQFH